MKTYNTTLELLNAVKAEECPIYPLSDIYKIIVDNPEIDKITLEDATELFVMGKYRDALSAMFSIFHEEDQLDYWVGGSINICETEEDLKQIQGCDFEWARAHNHTWPNVTDLPMSWDVCAYCGDTPDNGWAVFVLCTNNAGGPSYYVPQRLWEAARLTEHITKHKEHLGE
jgi:hypothetical protein